MLSSDLVTLLRTLVHDTGAGFSPAFVDGDLSQPEYWFTDEEIIDNLQTARDELIHLLAQAPTPPYVILAKMTKICAASEGTAVPDDFWKLICGYRGNNIYVPAVTIRLGEAQVNIDVDQVYVKSGVFHGTATFALYWAMPSQAITNTATFLNEFPDAFYHCVKYQAALGLIGKEQADAWTRYQSLVGDLQAKLLSLN